MEQMEKLQKEVEVLRKALEEATGKPVPAVIQEEGEPQAAQAETAPESGSD